MNETAEAASWKRAPGWMKLVLLVSLLGNAAVAGVLGGSWLKDDRLPNEPGLNRMQTRILYMVPESARDAARQTMLARRDEVAAAREAQNAAQTEMLAALRAEPFTAERLAAAMAARREASGRYWGIGYEQMVDIVKEMSPAERREFADEMEERYRRWMERRQRNR